MRKFVLSAILLLTVVAIISAFVWVYRKSQKPKAEVTLEQPVTVDIIRKAVATGAIVPREEVDVKPKVTGIVTALYVEPGRKVARGDALAKIEIVPDAGALNRAQSEVQSARIALDNATRELTRHEQLLSQGVIADADVARLRTDAALRKQDYALANSNLQIVKDGQTLAQGKHSNVVVTATTAGMVIDVPVKLGFSVIAANNFNPGTTIATIADMADMIFDGFVDEAEVAKLKEGMKLTIKIGAIEKGTFEGKLEFIAPKGKLVDGAIQFQIKAALGQQGDVMVRANYSANADVVLEEKRGVLALREALVQYEDQKPFVEVPNGPNRFDKVFPTLGIADGLHVEIVSGLAKDAKIKVPSTGAPEAPGGNKPPGLRRR